MTISQPVVHEGSEAPEGTPPQPVDPSDHEPTPTAAPVSAPTFTRLRHLMRRYDGPAELDGQLRLAHQLATARNAVPLPFRNPGDMLALMQHARALDIALATAWDNLVFNNDGVGGMRAKLMHALVIRAGHKIVPLHVDEKRVRLRLVRGDGGTSGSAQWTLFEAQRARLTDKDRSPWITYPEDLLWARCISRVCRRYASDVILGFYVPEDLDDIPSGDIDPVDLSTAVIDADGNVEPAPDVVSLLEDLDVKTFAEIRNLMQRAYEEGLLGAYAGTIDGIHHTVEEILFDKGTEAQQREAAMATSERPGPLPPAAPRPPADPADKGSGLTEGDQEWVDRQMALASDTGTPAAVDVTEAPAGTGDALPCGCNPAEVLARGGHLEGCTR